MWFLLQTDPTAGFVPDSSLVEQATEPKSFLDILIDGGWPMIVLGIFLILALFIFFERFLTIRKANADSEDFMKEVRRYVLSGDIKAAKHLCESRYDPFSRMILKGITRLSGGSSLKDIEGSIENVGNLEVNRLERRLTVLATVAGAAPMVGFLGTVLGMINAFDQIEQAGGNAAASELAGGISQAMVTTAGGLIVGVTAYLAYNYLVSQVNQVIFKFEATSTSFIDLLHEPAD